MKTKEIDNVALSTSSERPGLFQIHVNGKEIELNAREADHVLELLQHRLLSIPIKNSKVTGEVFKKILAIADGGDLYIKPGKKASYPDIVDVLDCIKKESFDSAEIHVSKTKNLIHVHVPFTGKFDLTEGLSYTKFLDPGEAVTLPFIVSESYLARMLHKVDVKGRKMLYVGAVDGIQSILCCETPF